MAFQAHSDCPDNHGDGNHDVLASSNSVVLDDRWAHLRDGAFVVRDKERHVKPIAHDPERERRLWDATTELVQTATRADS